MATAMLGMLPLSAVRGPRDTLDERLAGADGEIWLAEFKKFLRCEPTWLSGPSTEIGVSGENKMPPRRLRISGQSQGRFIGRHLQPAQLTDADVHKLLEACPRGQVYNNLHELLVTNGNNPVKNLHHAPAWIYRNICRTPFHGKHYRIATGYEDGDLKYQLWEVQNQ